MEHLGGFARSNHHRLAGVHPIVSASPTQHLIRKLAKQRVLKQIEENVRVTPNASEPRGPLTMKPLPKTPRILTARRM